MESSTVKESLLGYIIDIYILPIFWGRRGQAIFFRKSKKSIKIAV